MQPWIKKHSPKSLKGVFGHEKEKQKLKQLIEKNTKPILLYGGTGNGKTSSVHALSKELGLELVEVNASDTRNAAAIQERIGGAINQGSLFGTSKIILIDEVEGLSGTKDRGGIPAVAKLIAKSTFPVVIIGVDAYEQKLKELRKKSELVHFKPLEYEEITSLLKKICEEESIEAEEDALRHIARAAGGDARAAINDLQSSAADTKITLESVKWTGERDVTAKMQDALKIVFKTKNPGTALKAYDDVDEDIDKIFLWVEENLPREYTKPKDLARGFDNLSLANVFFGRIRKWQYYRFYVYCYALLSAGIALSKEEKYSSHVEYRPTTKLLKIWMANQKNAKRKGIAQKIALATHMSSYRAFHDAVPFIAVLSRKKESQVREFFDFNTEEMVWLKNLRK